MHYEVRELSKTYHTGKRTATAVNRVSLEIGEGEFIRITGRSGSGKTTLLQLLSGFLKPSEGSVMVDGKKMCEMTDQELSEIRNRKIGYIAQNQTLFSGLNVLENLLLPDLISGNTGDDAWAFELLQKLDAEELSEAFPGELTGGEHKRVMIARALINHPRIVIADEPTGNLDRTASLCVLNLFQKLSEEGTAVLLVTHDLLAQTFGNVHYIMDNGRLHKADDSEI